MKRQLDRDSPPPSKIARSGLSRFEDNSRDRLSPDRDRREGRKSPTHRANFPPRQHGGKSREISERNLNRNPHDGSREIRDEFSRNKNFEKGLQYKALCVSNIHHKVSDVMVRDVLLREFKKFGEVSVKVLNDGNERLAYVYFRNPEDAREARHSKNRAVLFDKQVNVDPLYPETGAGSERKGRRSFSPESQFPPSRPRGVSPATSNTSSASLNRRGRHGSMERNLPVAHPRDNQYRRENPGQHNEFPPQHRHEESKKEKFPNYLHHIPPEEDDKATRTLFIGNLEVNIQEFDLRRIFDRYGVVEDIDVKRPPPGMGNAYAFIKFQNLDMAHRAKVEMSGQYIGKFQCKIGYGKATPTTRIWVGGLGPWTSLSHLEREFDRFGAIKKIDFVKGDNHAYILYDSIVAAQAACQEMRGFPLGGPDRRLRVDFADTSPYNHRQPSPRGSFREENNERYIHQRRVEPDHIPQHEFFENQGFEFNQWHGNSNILTPQYEPYFERNRGQPRNDWGNFNERERRGSGTEYNRNWNRDSRPVWRDEMPREWNDRRKRPRADGAKETQRIDRMKEGGFKLTRTARLPECLNAERDPTAGNRGRKSPSPLHDPMHRDMKDPIPGGSMIKERRHSLGSDRSMETLRAGKVRGRDDYVDDRTRDSLSGMSGETRNGFTAIHNICNLQDIAKNFPVAWHGGLVLKNSAFPTRMHSCEGVTAIVDTMMKYNTGEIPMLRITQRLRMDQPKLDDVSKRIMNSGPNGHCILVGFTGSVQTPEEVGNNIQQRPLRNLVTYLKQKEAAGVISLPISKGPEIKDNAGVLYAFPPCQFSYDLLKRIAPNLTEGLKEDHLVIVVVRGTI